MPLHLGRKEQGLCAGKPSEIHIYPDVDRAFFNDENRARTAKAAAEDA